jgi:hypothetical protein
MRRFFSITTIAALMFSLVSPLLAAACPHSQQAMACHRPPATQAQQEHHCDMMAHQHQAEEGAPENSSSPAVKGVQSPESCPMNCCVAGHPTNAIAIAAETSVAPLAVIQQVFQFVPVVFARTGFSSHTDRGPPTR